MTGSLGDAPEPPAGDDQRPDPRRARRADQALQDLDVVVRLDVIEQNRDAQLPRGWHLIGEP
jgi:hypothetical protein